MRGVKKRNFRIMEQLSGGLGCWAPMSKTPAPGMIAGYTLQAIAHGADTVLRDISLREALNSKLFTALRDGDMPEDDHVGGCVLYEKREQVEELLTVK